MRAVNKKKGFGPRRRRGGGAHPVDMHVGSRIRARRTLLGLSQGALGEMVGLTFQQLQKYERGANRVGASRLFDLSRVLDVPMSFFFDEMDDRPTAKASGRRSNTKRAAATGAPLTKRETLELVRAYYRIDNAGVRDRVHQLLQALSAAA